MRFPSNPRSPALRPLLAIAIACLVDPGARADQLPPAPPMEWLFDGTSFSGWNGDTKQTWRIEDGAIAPREVYEPAYVRTKPAAALDDMEQFSARMRRMCREERVEFFDIRKAWEDYMLRSYNPYDHFARDTIHGNSRGTQIVGRILTRYFEPKDASR
jgi:hypothetical protein